MSKKIIFLTEPLTATRGKRDIGDKVVATKQKKAATVRQLLPRNFPLGIGSLKKREPDAMVGCTLMICDEQSPRLYSDAKEASGKST